MEDNLYMDEEPRGPEKSMKGYKIVILLLVVILGVISFQYFRQVRAIREDFRIERDTLTSRISNLITDIDNIQVANDTMNRNLGIERGRADSLMERLKNERSMNRATIRKYEKELGTLRSVMKRYVEQIDSLNRLNRNLAAENVTFRRQVSTERMRADMAEERATELSNKIRIGSIVKAREIVLSALNRNDRPVSRASRAERLRVDFVLTANELTEPGPRAVYMRITGPDGYVLANDTNALFDYEGDMLTYSATRDIDYQNQDLPVGLYYYGAGITGGTYKVQIYMDGYMIGEAEAVLK